MILLHLLQLWTLQLQEQVLMMKRIRPQTLRLCVSALSQWLRQISDSNMFKTKSRSSTLSSLVSSSNLVLVKDYHKLISNELVHGKFDVEKGGTYAFVFDNSFSKTISKKVLFSSKTLPRENVPGSHSGANGTSGNDTGSEPKGDAVVGNVMRPKNGQFLQSILLKKRRKKLQGFVKRLFVLNF